MPWGANGLTGVLADQSGSSFDQLLRVVGTLSERVREMTDKIERNRVMLVMLFQGGWLGRACLEKICVWS